MLALTLVRLFGLINIILLRLEQPWNAEVPMVVTLPGIVILFRPVQP